MHSWCCSHDKYLSRNIKQHYNDVLVYSSGNSDSPSTGQDLCLDPENVWSQLPFIIFIGKIPRTFLPFSFIWLSKVNSMFNVTHGVGLVEIVFFKIKVKN